MRKHKFAARIKIRKERRQAECGQRTRATRVIADFLCREDGVGGNACGKRGD
jgi:hypothetical protein